MTQPAQVRIARDAAGFRVAYVRQADGSAVHFSADGIVPSGVFAQAGSSVRYDLTLGNGGAVIHDDAGGLVDFLLSAEQSGGTIPYLDYFGEPGPCRLIARGTDAAGEPETYLVLPITMLNAASADVSSIPLPSISVAAVGPSGPRGLPGTTGDGFLDAIIFG